MRYVVWWGGESPRFTDTIHVSLGKHFTFVGLSFLFCTRSTSSQMTPEIP